MSSNKKAAVISLASVLVGFAIIGVMLFLVLGIPKSQVVVSCTNKGKSYVVAISNNEVTPALTSAQLCDSVTIRNYDPETRKIGFGDHDNHRKFNGIDEKILKGTESFTLLLTETGSGTFHDHFNYDVEGTITVTE